MRQPRCLQPHLLYPLISLAALIAALLSPLAQAANFVTASGETVTAQQTLHADETGLIQAGGVLSVVT